MAKQTSLFTYTGRLGKLSGFKRKGTHFVRTQPDGIHQTANTKKSASRFGKASSTGAFIRRSLNIVGEVNNSLSTSSPRFRRCLAV